MLAARERISVAEYEQIMGMTAPIGDVRGFSFVGVEDFQRRYERGAPDCY